MSGIGAQLYVTLHNTGPSFGPMLQAYKSLMDCFPFKPIVHFISSVLILDAFKGATRVHLVAYGSAFGIHWPFLMQQLAMQPNGPPYFRITGTQILYLCLSNPYLVVNVYKVYLEYTSLDSLELVNNCKSNS
jgi:hypothetical protein